jgi:hypothetical protein
MGMRDNWLKGAASWLTSVLLGRVTIPAWIAILMAIFLGIPAWSDAVRFWLDTAKASPSWATAAAPIITSAYFAPALGIFGLAYLLIVGFEGTDIVRHKIVPVVGWIVVGICFVSIVFTAGFGATEIYIRSEIAKGVAGIPRGASPAENNQEKPQRPLTFAKGATLQPNQIRILNEEVPKIADMLRRDMAIYMAPPVAGPRIDPTQFAMIFERNGAPSGISFASTHSRDEQGLMIFVNNINNIPQSAQKFTELLTMADIQYTTRSVPGFPSVDDTHWVLFFGPLPFD